MIAWIARQRYLLDNGMSFLSTLVGIFNSSMLIVIGSDKIKFATGIRHTWVLVIGAAITYVLGAWSVGKVMDISGYLIFINSEANKRNHMLMKAAGERHEKN